MAEHDGGSSDPAASKSPQEILDGLSRQLQEADAEAAESKQASESLKADITSLKAAFDTVGKAVDDYDKGRPGLRQQLQDRKDYLDGKRSLIEKAIGDRKDDADNAWDAFRQHLQDVRHQLQDRQDQLTQARQELAQKQQARDDARAAFDALMGRKAQVADRLKKLGDLKTFIEAAEDDNDAAAMYVALREHDLQSKLAGDDLLEVVAYREALETAWRNLDQAQTDVRDAEQQCARAQNQYDLLKGEPDRLQARRIQEVLKLLAAAPAPPGGGTPRAAA
jgi:chromosome segregation ATPase